jgi:hypothetical protein
MESVEYVVSYQNESSPSYVISLRRTKLTERRLKKGGSERSSKRI